MLDKEVEALRRCCERAPLTIIKIGGEYRMRVVRQSGIVFFGGNCRVNESSSGNDLLFYVFESFRCRSAVLAKTKPDHR